MLGARGFARAEGPPRADSSDPVLPARGRERPPAARDWSRVTTRLLLLFLRFSVADAGSSGQAATGFTLDNFVRFFENPYYRRTLLQTFLIGLGSTALTSLLGLAVAKLIMDAPRRLKSLLIILTVFPMLVGNVIRLIGWVALFGYQGLFNSLLTGVGIIAELLDRHRYRWRPDRGHHPHRRPGRL